MQQIQAKIMDRRQISFVFQLPQIFFIQISSFHKKHKRIKF